MSPHTPNLFLSSLSPASSDWLTSRCTVVALPLRLALYRPQQPPAYAFFPTSGLASIVASMANGGTAEVGIIGHEGVVGALHLLGPATFSTHCFMQIEGTGLRIHFADLQKAFYDSPEIRERILEFVQQNTLTLSQIAACNRLHEAQERLARWLLTVQDRTRSEVLNITQEFLAQMLGSQRTTVTLVAGSLQRSGLIVYERGKVRVLDRQKLEAAACDCYRITKDLYTHLYKLPLHTPASPTPKPGPAAPSSWIGNGHANPESFRGKDPQ